MIRITCFILFWPKPEFVRPNSIKSSPYMRQKRDAAISLALLAIGWVWTLR
jgi:hypothetical protein